MTPSVNRYRQFLHGILALLLFALAQSASAQWWRFGSDSGQPVFSDLLFNNVSALRVDRSLQFSPEDLDQHKIAVRGRAEVGQGKIGRVEASLDDGANWTAVANLEDAAQPERFHDVLDLDIAFEPVQARFVRIDFGQREEGKLLALAEVEIWAPPADKR